MPIRWHKLNVVLHRDVGYLAFALTIVYGVSGLAVNHRADWNPNIRQTRTTMTIAPVTATEREAIVADALGQLQLTTPPRSTFRPRCGSSTRTSPIRSICRRARSWSNGRPPVRSSRNSTTST